TTSEDRSVRLWEVATGRVIATYHGHRDFVQAVAFRPDGRELATGGMDGMVKFWDRRSSRPIVFHGHTHFVLFLAFRGDGRRILSASGFPRVDPATTMGWDPAAGEPDPALKGADLYASHEGFTPGATVGEATATTADGQLIAQVADDRHFRSGD